jgi:lipoprotein-releasing system permease protein
MASLSARIAWRYLKTRKREGFVSLTTWFAMIGIALGVATLILVTSLMNGVRSEMRDRFLGIDGHISISQYGGTPFTDYASLAATLETHNSVQSAVPKISGQVMATAHGRAFGAQVIALPEAQLPSRNGIYAHIETGKNMIGEGLFLGKNLARALGVRQGGDVTLMSPDGRATAFGFIPRMRAYRLSGILDFGMHHYDSALILMPFEQAQRFFKLAAHAEELPAVPEIELMLHHPDAARDVASQLEKDVLPAGFRATAWQQRNQTVFAALAIQRNVMVVILALIVLVAVFNIISTQMMLVQQKTGDIAILRTMGATRGMIRRVFLINGAVIGSLGTASGLVLGLIAARNLDAIRQGLETMLGITILPENIYFLSTLPTKTDPLEVVAIAVCAIGLSLAASLYPAARAARISPAEALRHE